MVPRFLTPHEYRSTILSPIGQVTNAMERTGCCVDLDRLAGVASQAAKECQSLQADLRAWAGREVNWSSWQQLAAFLHTDRKEDGGLEIEPSPYWKKGEVSLSEGEIKTDDRALAWLAANNPEHRQGIQAIRSLRRWQRAGTYAEDWLEKAIRHPDGTARLHPSFGLGSDHDSRPGAVTGRFGVKNPPLNQVPRAGEGPMGGLRDAFIAPAGCRLVVVDYSQLEIVLLAHLIAVRFGPDDPLVRAVRAKRDIHGPLARRVFGELAGDLEVATAPVEAFKTEKSLKVLRNLAKAGIYGNNYGKQDFSTTELPDGSVLGKERSDLLKRGLRGEYPGIFRYQGFIRLHIERTGSIVSLLGRLVWLPGARSPKMGVRNRAWRQALNYPMQAGGQEVMALALIAISRDPVLRDLGFTLSLVVHDEIVGWAPEGRAADALARVEELMVSALELQAPLIAEGHVGAAWSECK